MRLFALRDKRLFENYLVHNDIDIRAVEGEEKE